MKNKGCFLLPREIERKLSKSKNLLNFDLLGEAGGHGVKEISPVTAKGTSWRINPRRLSQFASKLVGVCDLRVGRGK